MFLCVRDRNRFEVQQWLQTPGHRLWRQVRLWSQYDLTLIMCFHQILLTWGWFHYYFSSGVFKHRSVMCILHQNISILYEKLHCFVLKQLNILSFDHFITFMAFSVLGSTCVTFYSQNSKWILTGNILNPHLNRISHVVLSDLLLFIVSLLVSFCAVLFVFSCWIWGILKDNLWTGFTH